MVDPDRRECQPHDASEELLPWYATGQLDEADRQRLEAHLSSCSHCREQLSLERRLVKEFRAIVPEVESGWSRLRARIESRRPAAQPRARRELQQFWEALRRPAVARLAAAQLAFVVLAGSLLISLSRPAYHTLGSAVVPPSANLIVIFRPEARMRNVDETLKSTHASIVEGPTDAGAYLLHVPAASRESVLSQLQSNGEVELAQPIDSAAQ